MARKKPAARARTKRRSRPPRGPTAPQEPLERLFGWGDTGRVIRNEELYRELLRSGVILRPPVTVGDDNEWKHDDVHYDFWYHGDKTEHDDYSVHRDSPPRHLDDRPGAPVPHGDSDLPPGGHGDQAGGHLDRTEPHQDYWFHHDTPPTHLDGRQHLDKHYDTPFEGHWDEIPFVDA